MGHYINEVECEVVPYDACEVIFDIQYMCRDATFYRRYNIYFLVKDDKSLPHQIRKRETYNITSIEKACANKKASSNLIHRWIYG